MNKLVVRKGYIYSNKLRLVRKDNSQDVINRLVERMKQWNQYF